MTPVVPQAGEPTDEQIDKLGRKWAFNVEREGNTTGRLRFYSDDLRGFSRELLASRPQQPQAETPLMDEQIDAIADSIMEPPDTSDAAEEDMDRALLRKFARAIAAHPNTGAHPPEAEPTHRHIKRGTFYTERGRGMLQTDRTLEDEAELVGYQGTDGRWWFRPVEEFDDAARFERVAPPLSPEAQESKT